MRPFLSPAVWTASARSTSGSFVRGSLTNSRAHMAPIPRASPIRSWPSAISSRRLRIRASRRFVPGRAFSISSTASRAAAHTTGLPPNVPPRPPGPGASITAGLPVTPPKGRPPPIAFLDAGLCDVRGSPPLRIAIRVGVVGEEDLPNEGAETLPIRLLLPREADVEQRATVEGGLEGHEPRLLRRRASNLHRILDGLGARVQEDRLREAGWRDVGHALREVQDRPVGRHHEADVGEAVQLGLRRSDHGSGPMPDGLDADPAA